EELTLYTFSTENFNRPDEEVETLFDLMEKKIDELSGEEEDIAHSNRIRVKAIGETDRLPEKIQNAIEKAEEDTKEYNRYQLNVAIGYGGRAELLKATREIMEEVKEGDIEPEEITTRTVSDHIYTAGSNDVDLIIRTGGDVRLSNFLPWQAKGNESTVYFCAPYWPEFRKIDFLRAIRTFGNRQRERRDRDLSRAVSLLRRFGVEEFNNIKEMVSRYNPETLSEKRETNRTKKTNRVSKND
ncbi:MAG: polyprenyl diphosphate synthase, partial [Halobacteria archaeon]|nr:polyprenyl diphosphate synthase [Halobacteria archaeon]